MNILILYLFLVLSFVLWILSKYLDYSNSRIERITLKNKSYDALPIIGAGIASKMGYPTINYKTNIPFPCGFYKVQTSFGEAIAIGFGNTPDIIHQNVELHYINYNEQIENQKKNPIKIYNVQKLNDKQSTFIKFFNQGCKLGFGA